MSRFVGSKGNSGLWQRIISEMPPHSVYVEPFLGTGTIMRKKKPADVSIGIDIDAAAPGLLTIGSALSGFNGIAGDALVQLTALRASMTAAWLIYCDPPYLASTRSVPGRSYYKHEFMTEAEHRSLLSLLLTLPARVIISGYRSTLYDEALSAWRSVTVRTVNRGGKICWETFWMNYSEPFEFHDIRYLGKDYRERERIKRKKQRWIRRLSTMSRLDRAAILAAIEAARLADTAARIDRIPPP